MNKQNVALVVPCSRFLRLMMPPGGSAKCRFSLRLVRAAIATSGAAFCRSRAWLFLVCWRNRICLVPFCQALLDGIAGSEISGLPSLKDKREVDPLFRTYSSRAGTVSSLCCILFRMAPPPRRPFKPKRPAERAHCVFASGTCTTVTRHHCHSHYSILTPLSLPNQPKLPAFCVSNPPLSSSSLCRAS